MTKKDYELIASAFVYGNTIPVGENQLYWVTDFLATKLEKQTPRFNRNKFLQACGIETERKAYKGTQFEED